MPSGRGWVPSSATRWTQRSRASRTILSYTRSATEERGVRSYDDFLTFSGIDRTTPSWWSSLACTASAIPVLSALDFSGAAKSRMPLQGR